MRAWRKLNRRSFLATVAGGAAAASLSGDAAAHQGCSDRDPTDPGGRGRSCTGCTDRDPTDRSGAGRNCRAGVAPGGCTDSDPTDRVGAGRNCGGRIAGSVAGACQLCSCTEYVQPTQSGVTACARQNCGHSQNRHAIAECRPGNQC